MTEDDVRRLKDRHMESEYVRQILALPVNLESLRSNIDTQEKLLRDKVSLRDFAIHEGIPNEEIEEIEKGIARIDAALGRMKAEMLSREEEISSRPQAAKQVEVPIPERVVDYRRHPPNVAKERALKHYKEECRAAGVNPPVTDERIGEAANPRWKTPNSRRSGVRKWLTDDPKYAGVDQMIRRVFTMRPHIPK